MTAEVGGRGSRGEQKTQIGTHDTRQEVSPIEERRY